MHVTAAGRLLALLHERGPLTRAAVTAELGLARSAIGRALDELAALDLVRHEPTASPARAVGRGRPSPTVGVNPAGPGVVAVHLLPDRIRYAVVGLGRSLSHVSEDPLPPGDRDPAAVVRRMAELVRRALAGTSRPCVGVGVAVPGVVRETDGFVPSSLHLGWTDVPLAERLTERLAGRSRTSMPVTVARASGLAALVEHRYGAGRGSVGLLGLHCEHTGIGAGFLSGGSLFTGSGYALEAGHIVVSPGGRECPCGARGCLELYADGRALLVSAGLPPDRPEHVAALLARAAKGDRAATGRDQALGREQGVERDDVGADIAERAVTATALHLVAGLTSLVNTLSPDRVVLTGFLADLHEVTGDLMWTQLANTSIAARAGTLAISRGTVCQPVVIGAADRAFESLLADPRAALRDAV